MKHRRDPGLPRKRGQCGFSVWRLEHRHDLVATKDAEHARGARAHVGIVVRAEREHGLEQVRLSQPARDIQPIHEAGRLVHPLHEAGDDVLLATLGVTPNPDDAARRILRRVRIHGQRSLQLAPESEHLIGESRR